MICQMHNQWAWGDLVYFYRDPSFAGKVNGNVLEESGKPINILESTLDSLSEMQVC